MTIFKTIATTGVAAFLGALVGAYVMKVTLASSEQVKTIDVLNVKRINVIEDDGSFALVAANSNRLPAPMRNGEEQGVRKGIPGIIFYNNFGDEIGGLIYPADDRDNRFDGGVQLSMDQINQTGQAIALRHWRNGNFVRSNLEITDYSTEKFAGDASDDPDIKAVLARLQNAPEDEQEQIYRREYLPLMGEKGYLAHRIFLGSEGSDNRRALLEIKDSRSRPRIRLSVDEEDTPRIEILNENGNVVNAFQDR